MENVWCTLGYDSGGADTAKEIGTKYTYRNINVRSHCGKQNIHSASFSESGKNALINSVMRLAIHPLNETGWRIKHLDGATLDKIELYFSCKHLEWEVTRPVAGRLQGKICWTVNVNLR